MQDGKTYSTWLPAIEAKLIKEFEMEKENALVYGKKNKGVSSAVGYEVDTFPGLIEQLETSGNNHYYSRFSVNLIEEYLSDIYFSRVSPGEIKEIVALTGYYGMTQASQAMQQLIQQNGSWRFVGTTLIQLNKLWVTTLTLTFMDLASLNMFQIWVLKLNLYTCHYLMTVVTTVR